jgi:hypothetical protein
MSRKKFVALVVAVIAEAIVLIQPVLAARVVDFVSKGRVTAVSGNDHVTVDGKSYAVEQGTQAAAVLQGLRVGQVIEARFSGPPDSSLSKVIMINVQQ